eukprot:TRINITY_DN39296_c0_g1_i1.p1 TRINITY_DN39296_c0_g1~~TRINITY_DN39296_c0_g1_i1.p1  ORF type:complete len:219 (-),score=42.56 TRINITY_DN39296_c0_g1_i1:42-668(-)
MELHVVETEGVPEGCYLSMRAGNTRRQAALSSDRPFRFGCSLAESSPFKIDVLEPMAATRLVFRPGEEKMPDSQFTIPLAPSASLESSTPPSEQLPDAPKMSITVALQPDQTLEKEEPPPQRPSTTGAGKHNSIGQATAARDYLDKHNLVEFTQNLVQSVIKEQPDKPYDFMARQFFFPDPEPRTLSTEKMYRTMATIGAHRGGADNS